MNNMVLTGSSFDSLYKRSIVEVLTNGEQVTARGLDFKELQFAHLVLTNPRNRIITVPARKLSKRFMMGEFIWIMGGHSSLDQIQFYNKRYANFSDNGIDLRGAYGPRLRRWGQPAIEVDQLANTLKKLKEDIYSRQAVIVIMDPAKDLITKTKDVPCNNYLQFLFRGGKLHLMCYVRSNDLYLGIPYDVFHWTMLQEIMACELGVPVGEYHHIVGSFHIYNSDIEKMAIITQEDHENGLMEPMPKETSIADLDDLNQFEMKYRITGEFDTSLVKNSWWHDKLEWLKK